MTKSLCNYLTRKTINCQCSIDAHFYDEAGAVSLPLLPINAANTLIIYNKDHTTF